ncbi:hypothetical protein B0F90DRAFT_1666617 [Multifurca ochricompacta]|uniref:Uncharacterized protein n=1 Tax=Multifurca ochricompacta TaxID=376703 RepID=A0AAD4M7Y1_9AGAM|nr:hypothetical protein B0F90DRAFT_1666617 [Multifurca ochricompacta]
MSVLEGRSVGSESLATFDQSLWDTITQAADTSSRVAPLPHFPPTPDSFNWSERPSSSDSTPEVKLEQASDTKAFYVPSSSNSAFASKASPITAAPPPIRRHSSAGSQLRRSKQPYSTSPHGGRIRNKYGGEASKMSSPNYPQQWGVKTENEAERQQAYAFAASGAQLPIRRPTFGEESRPRSSGSSITSSSLRGAMGDIHLSSNSESSNSPSPTSDGSQHRQESYNVASGMVWSQTHADVTSQPAMQTASFDDHSNPLSFQNISSPSGSLASNSPSTSHTPPVFSTAGYSESFNAYHQARPPSTAAPPLIIPQLAHFSSGRGPIPITPTTAIPVGARLNRSTDDELRYLRNKVRELELINESARLRIRELENELANPASGPLYSSSSISGLPSPAPQLPTSPSFAASWKARTDARIKLFCSLNRAGNALCAWHDSRRERRAHPPRMAPPGHLNCGCTFEEALFEESLSRHDVGSYHPGESVRMDPALRNPLLKLLQKRYGYKDGDFEREPVTGNWIEGEGPVPWEARALAGISSHRKHRAEEHR